MNNYINSNGLVIKTVSRMKKLKETEFVDEATINEVEDKEVTDTYEDEIIEDTSENEVEAEEVIGVVEPKDDQSESKQQEENNTYKNKAIGFRKQDVLSNSRRLPKIESIADIRKFNMRLFAKLQIESYRKQNSPYRHIYKQQFVLKWWSKELNISRDTLKKNLKYLEELNMVEEGYMWLKREYTQKRYIR